MKLARIFWSLGSFLVNGIIIIYIILSRNAPVDAEAKYAYINDNWSVYSAHWKVEFLLMNLVAIGALYFAAHSKKISWSIISIGQILLLLTYPIMLGGYRNTPLELAEMANEVATTVFVFANFIFLSGLFLLYFKDRLLQSWLRTTAVVLACITALAFSLIIAEIIKWEDAMVIAPLMNILYLINAYYGIKLTAELN